MGYDMNAPLTRPSSSFPPAAMDGANRQAEIPHQMECLQRTLDGCIDTFKQLEMRLCGVVRSEPPAATMNEIRPQVSSVPTTSHGGSLAEMVKQAAALNMNLQSVLSRLEV